jgi:hypothetical protein
VPDGGLQASDLLLYYPVQYEGQECSRSIFYTGPHRLLHQLLSHAQTLLANSLSRLHALLVCSAAHHPLLAVHSRVVVPDARRLAH